jgi:hypothetical protein
MIPAQTTPPDRLLPMRCGSATDVVPVPVEVEEAIPASATTDHAKVELPEQVTVALPNWPAPLRGRARPGGWDRPADAGDPARRGLRSAGRSQGPPHPARAVVRHGSEPGQVTLGGRRVSVSRSRVRTADGTGKVTVPTYQAFASTDLMDQLALEWMLAKLSSAATRPGRRNPTGIGVADRSKVS